MKVEEINIADAAAPTRTPPLEWSGADANYLRYERERITHWDKVARWMDERTGWGGAYRRRLTKVYQFFVPRGARVLEVGCAQGDLLAALAPGAGVGVDFSAAMLERAERKYPNLRFIQADAHALELDETFDVIILSDVVNDVWDVQQVLQQLARLATPETRLIINFQSHLWEWPLSAARALGLARPNLTQNWLTFDDVKSLLALAGFEVIRHREEMLLPLPVPPLSTFANRYLIRFWPFNLLALTHFIVARPIRPEAHAAPPPLVSVVIPARDEAGNIADIFARMPEMGAGTEMVFVEGGSTDGTYEVIAEEIARRPERRCKLLKQKGKGKIDAVRLGFANAAGDVLMIFDADLTVPPEDMPRFLEVLTANKADFANPSRLVYPMEDEAMRFFNLVGNKFFGLAFSWLLDQTFKDTLCGTKVLWRRDYDRIVEGRAYFGDFDPFGEFDLLFGAAKLNLKIMDVPVRHRARTYGTTKIPRWSGGVMLLRMVLFAARRIKFI